MSSDVDAAVRAAFIAARDKRGSMMTHELAFLDGAVWAYERMECMARAVEAYKMETGENEG